MAEGKQEASEKAENPKAPAAETMKRAEENVVFIGRKPVMQYVMACLTFFNAEGKQVCIKAREEPSAAPLTQLKY